MTVCCYLLLGDAKVDPIDNVEWLLDLSWVSVETVADDSAEVDFQRSKRAHSVMFCWSFSKCCLMPGIYLNIFLVTKKVQLENS